jgi:molybdate transport system ATP-binding protein
VSLAVDVALERGAFALDATFTAGAGVTVLFGRSGAGKSTVVDLVAGLVRPDRGRIALDDVTLVDTARRIHVPPHRRRVGYVFQDARLLPHLSVRQNLLYGRWFTPPAARTAEIGRVVELLGIGHLLARRPAGLSGFRALLASPRLLLLDEPLASLDGARKAEILPYLERLRDEAGLPILYVTHALAEVARLATTLVVLSAGRVVAAGPLGDVLARVDLGPIVGRFEAGAVLTATVARDEPAWGLTVLDHAAGELLLPRLDLPPGTLVRVRVRARDVALATAPITGLSIRNRLAARVVELREERETVLIRLDAGGEPLLARITRLAASELGLAPGRDVVALVKTVVQERGTVTALDEGEEESA